MYHIYTSIFASFLFFCTKHYWAVTQMRSTRGGHSTRDLISISTFPFPRRVNRSISVWTVDGDHCNKKQPDRGCRWHCDSFTFILNSPQRGWLVGQIIVMHPGLNMLHCTYMQGDEIKKSSLVFCDFHHLSLTFQPLYIKTLMTNDIFLSLWLQRHCWALPDAGGLQIHLWCTQKCIQA